MSLHLGRPVFFLSLFFSETLSLWWQDLEQRHQQKLKMQAEIKRINDESQRQKAELLAQEKLADQMVMEFTKKKMVGTRLLMPGTSEQEWNVCLREGQA